MNESTGVSLADAPMAGDRNLGWDFVSSGGAVFENGGAWYLTSLEAVQFAHRHPELFCSGGVQGLLGAPVPLVPLTIDPPDHLKFRKVLDPLFAPRVINRMEDQLRTQARELITAFAERGECDIVADLARLYPTGVFLTMFGMPIEHRDRYLHWVETLVELSGAGEVNDEVAVAGIELFTYLQEFIETKRANPGDDLLSGILALSGDEEWTNDEILGMCFLFTLAGLDTVTAVIGFIFLHLARNPELRHRMIADPTLVGPTIEEILRLELPAPTTPRFTTQDVEICGTTIPAGALVFICLATANRDAERFGRPGEIDIDQPDRGHLSFGGGIHRCLGSHLARRELRLVVEEFHRLIPDYEIADGAQPECAWPSGTLHLGSLPIVFPAVCA